jgi:LysM repeat protein
VAWLVQRRAAGPAERPARARRPAVAVPVLAGGTVLVLLAIFTWQAARPLLALLEPDGGVRATPFVVPTPTPTATPFPTPTVMPLPTTTPLPSTTPLPAPARTYVVQPGDTLQDIARAFDVSLEDLMQVNGIAGPDALQVGQVLAMP